MPIWKKLNLSTLLNSDLQDVFLSKANSILAEKNVLDAGAPNIDGILERYPCFSNQLNIHI
jgi:hypothetical protein